MRAMILAAGRGDRMGKLTVNTPKPLLRINGHYLIDYAIANIKWAGIHEIVINISYHAEQIKTALGNGERHGVSIIYSEEKERLETGGGIFQALPLLGSRPFLVMSSDIITDYPLQKLFCYSESLAHLLLVNNPPYHPYGDFGLRDGNIDTDARPTYTYANIGVYRPEFFTDCEPGYFRLAQVLKPAISSGLVTGELYHGMWHNIGTPDDLVRAREDSNLRPLVSETNTLSS